MAIKDRTQLKQYFETGKRPTQSQFGDLIDSLALLSEITEIPDQSYKVFSALLRVENDSLDINRPNYVVKYNLLEANTIGNLNINFTRDKKIRIQDDMTLQGLLPFERRFLTLGGLRVDYNFDSITESDDISDVYIDLIFNIKLDYGDGTSIPVPVSDTPIFYNLPIEIRVYDEMEEISVLQADSGEINL